MMRTKKGRIICILLAISLATACEQGPKKETSGKKAGTRTSAQHQEKSQKQKAEQKKVQEPLDPHVAVASYQHNMDDEWDNNDMVIQVFPSAKNDVYRLDMQYGQNKASDEVTLPPREYYQKVALRQGSTDDECILGIVDKDGKFLEMKSIKCSTTSIKVTTLKAFYISNQ